MSKFLLARKHFKLCAVLTLGYNLIPYVMFVGGLFVFESLYEGLLCYVAADILIAVAITIWILRKFAPCSPDLKLASRYVKYSAPLALSEIEGGLLSKVDRYTIAFFMDLKFLAVYNVMANVFMMFDALNAPIRKQIMSYLPKPWDAGYREDTISLLRQILLLFCVLVIGLIWCVSLHMEILLGIIMGDVSYVDSLTLTASLLGVAALLSNIRRFFNQLIKLNNRSMHVLVFQLLGLFPSILLNILLVPSYGLVGASVASLISYATIVGTMNYRYSLAIDTDFLKAVGKVVLLASLMSLVYYLVDPHTWLTLILSATLSIGIYAALCAVLLRGLYRPFRESLTRVRDHKY
jgi:O-antigen/teichoic acid export membrane protein